MEYRQLGNSKVKVTSTILGTWAIGGWLWGGTDDEAAIAAIRKAVDLGMTSIDTAPVYGFGHSEELIAKALEGRRDKVQLLTKYGLRWDLPEGAAHMKTTDSVGKEASVVKHAGKESVLKEVEDSLRRLKTDRIDLYQCHWPDESTPFEETMKAIDQLLKQGKILAAGVSNFSPEQMDCCRKVVELASDQPPYSMVKRDIEKDVIPYCVEHNIAVIVYSPLQRGLLTGKVDMNRTFPPDDGRSMSPYFKPENRRRVIDFLAKIKPIADGHNVTLAQLAINWTIHRPGITAALVGARNPRQAEENAGATAFTLTDEETKTINDLLDELHLEL